MARILIVAGSDSGGGAGVQADIKTVTMLGGYAASAITAITVQNSLGVSGVHVLPAELVADQMRVVLEDIGADVVKSGMLPSASIIDAVAGVLADYPDIPLILDPVMVATSGDPLIDDDAVSHLVERLLPRAALITPNLPEAARLAGFAVADVADMRRAGQAILAKGAGAVLVKGGHGVGATVSDLLIDRGGEWLFEGSRIDSRHSHGTGCTLASAIATGLGQGLDMRDAVERARDYVRRAMRAAPGYGAGHGPLGHGCDLRGNGDGG